MAVLFAIFVVLISTLSSSATASTIDQCVTITVQSWNSKAFAEDELVTGSQSGATGKVVSEDVEDDGSRVMTYAPVSGIFQDAETITGGDSGVTSTVYAVWGLRGVRDRTLHHRMHIDYQGLRGLVYEGMPDYGTLDAFMFSASEVESASSALTFRSHSVYVVRIPYSTLSAAINNSVTTTDTITICDGASLTIGNNTYQVGEFTTSGPTAPQSLIVKLLKGTNFSPNYPN